MCVCVFIFVRRRRRRRLSLFLVGRVFQWLRIEKKKRMKKKVRARNRR